MLKLKQKLLNFVLVGGLLVATVGGTGVLTSQASGLSRACEATAECRKAAAEEAAASAAAASANAAASAYEARVNDLSLEIASKQSEINETEAHVEELRRQIEENEQKLADEQDALAELLVNMHFEGDAEPITILAGASSISDLAEKQARGEVAKQQIVLTAQKIKETKAKLEEDKKGVEAALAALQQERNELAARREEQAALVAKYQNDAAGYEAVAAAAREAKQAAERKWQEENRSSLNGLAYYSGDDTYPWQADCPQKQDYYLTSINGRKVGGYVCECVSYVGWKAYEWYGLYLAWGNAYSWDDNARAAGYKVNNTPAAGTIGQVDGYPYGHVFWVESVNSDGSINVTEYNNSYATYLYSGSYRYGDFGARKIPASELWQYNFIHL